MTPIYPPTFSDQKLRAVQGNQIREALDCIEALFVDGLRHGFFQFCIECEVGNGGRRQVLIRAGKSQKFTIPENELPR